MKYNNFNEVPATVLAGAQKDLLNKLQDGTILFEEFTNFLKMNKKSRREEYGPVSSFIVSEVFGHRTTGQVPQWMSDDFQRIVYNPSKDMVIEIPDTLAELKYYTLPKNMNDSTIQKNSGSQPMTLEQYWLVRHMLIISRQADKTKYYIFHVKIGDKVFTLDLNWFVDEWGSNAGSFDFGFDWTEGVVAVSLL